MASGGDYESRSASFLWGGPELRQVQRLRQNTGRNTLLPGSPLDSSFHLLFHYLYITPV